MRKYQTIYIMSCLILFLGMVNLYAQEETPARKMAKDADYTRVKDFNVSFLSEVFDASDLDFDVVGGKNYLLLIACDKYKYWKPLFNAVKDAQDVKKILMDRYGFEPNNIFELLNEEVTLEAVEAQFQALIKKGTNLDNLLIYYSGHGYYDSSFDLGYWVPYDGRTNSAATSSYIPNDKIRDYIKEMNFRHVFMVADACFSGSLFSTETTRGSMKEESVKSRWGLSSGNLEVVSDGKKGENSPFAKAFMDFLNSNLQDKLLVDPLIQYVISTVKENSEQEPRGSELVGVGSEGGQFVFTLQGQTEATEEKDPKSKSKSKE
ncbi:MAG: caspase family protein [Microscillaceae bacterium]|nr:caspase family protein [Microscillaceae bacterium]